MNRFSILTIAALIISLHTFAQSGTDTTQWKSLKNYGAKGNDTTDDQPAIQAFIDSCAKYHYTGYVPDGKYVVGAPLKLRSNLKMVFAENAVFLQAFTISTGAAGSFLQQDTPFSNALSNVTLKNFHYAMKAGTTWPGRVMSLWCNDLTLESPKIDSFSGAICMFLAGDRVRINGAVIHKTNGATGEGGIRFVGGNDFMCSNAYVESGDDCFQFVPAANPTDPFYNLSISNGTYINCKGHSYAARLIVAANEENNTSRVHDCYFINITGIGNGTSPQCINLSDQSCTPVTADSVIRFSGGSTRLVVRTKTNRNFRRFNAGDSVIISKDTAFNGTFLISSVLSDTSYTYTDATRSNADTAVSLTVQHVDADRISDITLTDVTASRDSSGTNAVLVDHIKNLKLHNTTLHNVQNRAVYIADLSNNISIDHFKADKATDAGSNVIEVDTSSNVSIDDATIYAHDTTAILVGIGTSAKSTAVSIRNSRIYNIPNNNYGINFNSCVLPTAYNNYFERAAGATTSNGIRTAAATTLGKIMGNSFDNVDNPVNDLDTAHNSNTFAFNTPLGKPTITTDTGAGTMPVVSLGSLSNDVAGEITLTPGGTAPTPQSVILTVHFAGKKSSKPKAVLLTGASIPGAAITRYYVDEATLSSTSFTVKSTSTALTSGSIYKIYYKVEW